VLDLIKLVGAFAGLAAFLGLAVLCLLFFAQARDLRRLREWAGAAPERDAALVHTTTQVAAERAEQLRQIEDQRRRTEEASQAERRAATLREQRRDRRERGLPEQSRWERLKGRLGSGRRTEPRYLALIAGAVIVLGGGVAFAALQVLGDDDGRGSAAADGGASRPADIEVAVLNGTSLSGLAGRTGDRLERQGFQLGAVTNSTQSFTTSVVMFRRGHRPEAQMIARGLGIREVTLMTSEVATPAAGALVAVVVGEDRATAAPSG
jgi:hypothetical protein